MTTTIDLFSKWAKKSSNLVTRNGEKKAVVYTRVSSKEQFDSNLSLDWQRKAIEEYSARCGFEIKNYFGGVYESAKTDGRKEFQRMLEFVRKNKNITHILVYLLDRFSRTGGGAIKLAKDLREKYGVTIVAVTQPIDTSNPGGVFQQNIQFLFSEYDNQLRRQRAMAGIKEKFERGIWCIKPPMGYSITYSNNESDDERSKGDRKIVVNETGKKLRKAFEWKAQGLKNEEILERLKAMGVKIYKQKLSMIFSNPFYCGIISNRMLEGKLVEGKHEKLVSRELFLQVNEIRAKSGGKYGVVHKKQHDHVPLKVFMKCDKCNQGYTGYIVKAKNLWYYKCRTKGCCNNKSAKKVNSQFVEFLSAYSIQSHLIKPFAYAMKHQFVKLNESQAEEQRMLKVKLSEVQGKIDSMEEDYFINKSMPAETYEKFISRFTEDKAKIIKSLEATACYSSNLAEMFCSALTFSSKLATMWDSSDVNGKEKLQKLVFPQGIVYDLKNEAFRTEKVNEVFRQIAELNSVSGQNETGQTNAEIDLSSLVGMTGFEPATPTSRT